MAFSEPTPFAPLTANQFAPASRYIPSVFWPRLRSYTSGVQYLIQGLQDVFEKLHNLTQMIAVLHATVIHSYNLRTAARHP